VGLAQIEEETTESQVGKLTEAIQQLQARVAELELQAVPSTLQEVRDQREETARSAVERIRALASECKKLSDRSAQTYEHLAEDPELRTLEAQLQEAKQQASTVQAQLKLLTTSGEDEEVTGAVRSSAAGHFHPEQSDGGDTETPAGAGRSLHTF
jgi:chromosome segregation ATPase